MANGDGLPVSVQSTGPGMPESACGVASGPTNVAPFRRMRPPTYCVPVVLPPSQSPSYVTRADVIAGGTVKLPVAAVTSALVVSVVVPGVELVAPVAPAPVAPVAPVAPAAPVAPVAPGAPVAPVAPIAP